MWVSVDAYLFGDGGSVTFSRWWSQMVTLVLGGEGDI